MDERGQMEIERKELLAGVMTLFGEFFILDLESGAYKIYKMDEVMSTVVTGSDFEEFNRTYGAKLIYPGDRKKFFDAFLLDNIRKKVREGKKKIAVEVRRKNEEGIYHWCELISTPFEPVSGVPTKAVMTFRDIDDLRTARQEEKYANQRFETAVSNTYDAIYEGELYSDKLYVWKSPENKLKDFIFMGSIEKQINLAVETSVHPDYRDEFKRIISKENLEREFENGTTSILQEIPRLCTDGVYRWFSFQVQLLDMTKEEIHAMYYLKDVDYARREEKRKQEELQQALSLAKQANAAKTDFLSRMSHDIRTPMNAIIGMTTIAGENTENPEKIKDCLKKIDVSAKFLLSLINDILDMSKIESGKVIIDSRSLDFGKLIGDVETICRDQAERGNQEFKVELGAGVRRFYKGDGLRLKQILLNITGNALKYTPEGGKICLAVDASEDTEDAGRQWLTIKVTDNGIGISESFLKKLYEPFEQENAGVGRVFEGSGLGLSITLNLINLMGGTIDVKSRQNGGTEFTVKLPLGTAEEEPNESVTAGTETSGQRYIQGGAQERGRIMKHNFHQEKILLVEDNEINREIAETLLRMQGLMVDTAVNGLEAVEKFAQSKIGGYRAILMDIRMPVMDGLEATRAIRELTREDACRIPIIAMTANAFQDEQTEALSRGMNDYLTKPVDAEEMYRHLERLFYTQLF